MAGHDKLRGEGSDLVDLDAATKEQARQTHGLTRLSPKTVGWKQSLIYT